MPAERFFLEQDLLKGARINLEGAELHHLSVMRMKSGDGLELVNGRGVLAKAIVETIDKKKSCLLIQDVKISQTPKNEVILAQAIPRLNRLDYIVEKGTELGMTQLWLFPGHLSERKALTPQQKERVRSLSIAAMKQSGRLFLPKMSEMPVLEKWAIPDCTTYFGDVEPAAPLLDAVWKDNLKILFFIGPEAGFTSQEIALFKKMNAKGVKLSRHVLRTDTAAITALAILEQKLMQ